MGTFQKGVKINSSKSFNPSELNNRDVIPSNVVTEAPKGNHIRFSDDEDGDSPKVEKKATTKQITKPSIQPSKTNNPTVNLKNTKSKNIFEKTDNKPVKTSPVPSGKKDDTLLLKEITFLGGTKKDFDLLKDIDSDEEIVENETSNSEDKPLDLTNDLNKFIKQLGISKLKLEDPEDSALDQKEQNEGLEEDNVTPAVAQPEDPEEEILFNPSDSIVTNIASKRIFASNSVLKPKSTLFNPLINPLFESSPIWYEFSLSQLNDGKEFSSEYATSLRNQARTLWEQECNLVSKKTSRSSDRGLMEQIMRSGTLSDKISALTLKIQEAPLHHINELNKLLSMMKRNNRREAIPCLNSFKDLCVGNLLPSDRKLVFFEDQPLSSPDVTQKHLIIWYFEDFLKKAFFDFLLVAEARSHDPVGTAKHNVLTHFYELLSSKPEQGANLLTLLANKLGDKENKIASRASHLLLRAIELNPELKAEVVAEIDTIVSRPNISIRAQYYSSLTLNQFLLNISEVQIANQLIEIYFRLFKRFLNVNKPGEKEKKVKLRHRDTKKNAPKASKVPVEPPTVNTEEEISRTITAILSGVNRAFPYADIDPKVLEEHISTLFHISRTFNFNAAIQALTLLMQITDTQPQIRPRLRKALYLSLLDPRIIHSSKQAMHLNLLHRFLKDETDLSSLMAFVKRMSQVASWHQPPYVNGLLYIISKLSTVHPVVNSSINHPEDVVLLDLKNTSTTDKSDELSSNTASLETPKDEVINSLSYEGRDDAPSKSRAEYTCLWELDLLLNHFHPTVAHFGRQILSLKLIKDQPELQNHTLIHFLDRFAYRNAKKSDEPENNGVSSTQTSFAPNSLTDGIKWTKNGVTQNDLMDEGFIKKNEDQVAADQIFFHKYFNLQKDPLSKKKSKSQENVGSDGEEEFFASLFGGPGDKDLDEDLGEEMMDFSGSEGEDNAEVDDNNNPLVYGEDAPGFDDFSGSEQLGSDAESEVDQLSVKSDEDSNDQNSDSDGDIDFGMDSDNEASFSKAKKDKSTSNKRKLQTESSDEEITSEKKPIDNKKRNQATKERKKKLRALPTFASLDDYSGMLSD